MTRSRRKIRRCLPRSRYSYREYSPQGRFLEVFEVVQFEHLPCTSDTGLEGTCLHEIDCTNQGGTGMGSCADGFGTCCIVYVEVSNVEGPLIFSMQTITEEARLYSIKITQLTAWDQLAAPTGCLQYFKEDQGHLESFNYRDRSEIGILRSSSYMNNFNYAMCIERAPNSCSVTYTNVGEMQIVNYDTDGLPVIPPQQAGVEIFNCPTDYLLIAAVRLCGERLNDGSVLQDFSLDAPVTDDSAGPIVIRFRSDGIYTGRGFKLHYQQNSCAK
ncbi:unnamed protein product [Danaus chrysippus]|uniref:(African queen) hypothetical protein n=1 Tax=Danaus chrysippus TaxID=151541 RepID=A0A8J2QHA8_9NEOP|nr:unnamed protein product [Danaus chrysippus]